MDQIQGSLDDRLSSYLAWVVARNPASLRVWVAQSEGEFIEAAELALEQAIVQTEGGARLYGEVCERGLSHMLANLLSAAGIEATAEAYHNGHVDVTLTHPRVRSIIMLGECKIYNGFGHHCNGCGQVLNRYSSGRSTRVFSLDYFRVKEMYIKLKDLRDEFDTERPHEMIRACADHRVKGGFVSAHKHSSGSEVEVLHCGCNLYFET